MKSIFIHPLFEKIFSAHPFILIDVGASGGVPRVWLQAKKALKVIGFEPDSKAFEEFKKGKDSSQKFINVALHSLDTNITLYKTRKQECTSVFMPNYPFLKQFPDVKRYEVIDSSKVNARQLSREFLVKEGISDVDFLKVDTQGSELYVLRGATELIDSFIFGINIEVEFAPLYQDQPLFNDVDTFLRSHGFQIFDIRRYYWKRNPGLHVGNAKGQLVFADALYFKTYESFVKGIHYMDGVTKKAKTLKAISICLIYNKVDYALYLCEMATRDNILKQDEKEIIFKQLYRRRNRINLKGRYIFAKLLHHLYNFIKSDKFYFSDEELGE